MAAGAADGIGATFAMTGWMQAGQLFSRHGEQPPKRLVRGLGRRAGIPSRPHRPGTLLATGAAHRGLDASSVRSTGPSRVALANGGVIFGLAVMVVSYAGWIPALVILPPPHTDVPGRAWTILTAHVVYGGGWAARLRGTTIFNRKLEARPPNVVSCCWQRAALPVLATRYVCRDVSRGGCCSGQLDRTAGASTLNRTDDVGSSRYGRSVSKFYEGLQARHHVADRGYGSVCSSSDGDFQLSSSRLASSRNGPC